MTTRLESSPTVRDTARLATFRDVGWIATVSSRAFATNAKPRFRGWRVALVWPLLAMAVVGQCAAKEQWVAGRSTAVALLAPNGSKRARVRRAAALAAPGVLAVLVVGLLTMVMVFDQVGALVLGAIIFSLAAIWMVLATMAAKTIIPPRAILRDFKEMKRALGSGWTVEGLVSDGSEVGQSLALATFASAALPAGEIVFASASTERVAKLYSRRMTPWGDSGLVFYRRLP